VVLKRFWQLALFTFVRGHMTHHVPESLAVRGWRRPNHPTVCTVIQLHACAVGFKHGFGVCSWFKHTEVHFGEPETASLKEENGRRPIFFIFWPIEVP
jgi:hypothetical protein